MNVRNHALSGVCSVILSDCALSYVSDSSSFAAEYASGLRHFLWDGFSDFSAASVLMAAACAACFLLGSIVPDCDNENSAAGRVVHIPVTHRTWLHAVYLPAVLILCGIFVPHCVFLLWCGIGWCLHLFWDSLSFAGVCFFYPFPGYRRFGNGAFVKRRHYIRLYRQGGASEYAVVSVIVSVTVFVLLLRFGVIVIA